MQKLGALDRIDIDACSKRGIAVSTLPDAGHVAVAEHTVMFMLCMARRAWHGHAAILNGEELRARGCAWFRSEGSLERNRTVVRFRNYQ